MKFRTKYDKPVVNATEPGTPIQPEYQLVIKDDGSEELEQTGYTDLQAYIQSHRDSVDINLIMARVKNGETELLDKAKGLYADVSELPCNLQDALNLGIRGEKFYNNLPLEIKSKFSSYIDMVNNPGALFDAIEQMEKVPEQKEPEQKEPEQKQPEQKQTEQKEGE